MEPAKSHLDLEPRQGPKDAVISSTLSDYYQSKQAPPCLDQNYLMQVRCGSAATRISASLPSLGVRQRVYHSACELICFASGSSLPSLARSQAWGVGVGVFFMRIAWSKAYTEARRLIRLRHASRSMGAMPGVFHQRKIPALLITGRDMRCFGGQGQHGIGRDPPLVVQLVAAATSLPVSLRANLPQTWPFHQATSPPTVPVPTRPNARLSFLALCPIVQPCRQPSQNPMCPTAPVSRSNRRGPSKTTASSRRFRYTLRARLHAIFVVFDETLLRLRDRCRWRPSDALG